MSQPTEPRPSRPTVAPRPSLSRRHALGGVLGRVGGTRGQQRVGKDGPVRRQPRRNNAAVTRQLF